MPENNTVEYTGKVIKKLLPDSMNGKAYKKANQNIQWIVIHNMGGKENGVYKGGTNAGSYEWWAKGAGGANTSAHYCVDDKEIWQTLEDNWKGHHTGSPKKGYYGADRGANNSNSIGIEVSDHTSVDKNKAIELTIELARYLVKKYSLSIDNVIQHYDISGKDCPQWIRNNNKWEYIKQQIKLRNDEQRPISFDSSTLDTSGSPSTGGSYNSSMPNFDNREDMNNLEAVKGVVLVNMPPYHFYSVKNKEEAWAKEHYNKEFHYLTDSSEWTLGKDTNLIAMSLQDNDRHTYIDRALFGNKSYRYTLNIGIFTSHSLQDYTQTEKILIDNVAKTLYENGLKTKHLWREFDLNREPSPFMYLDREQWKLFLREVDKQVEWRYENFGEPELPETPEYTDSEDNKVLITHIGKSGNCNRRCTLRVNPNMYGPHVKVLDEGTPVQIIDYKPGFYKIETIDDKTKGWVVYTSITISETFNIKYVFKTKNKGIPQPEIKPTMTHEKYEFWKSLTDPKAIDEFAAECEPYDKGLPEIISAPITNDDRLTSLTKEQKTKNENTIYYSVTEGSPGGTDHCVKPASELNTLYKPDKFRVDPIYPDLIVPPNYSTADNNKANRNSVPLTALEEGTIKTDEDYTNLTFDFDLLKEMNKVSKGKPVNYLDPYPYDDKVYELEKHSPKVKIDEIESRLYECNHPGCPIAQPMAKNFAMLNDMALNQSKKIESRLVRLENTLAFVLRSLGRVGARVNVNCVYYGGQDTFGKYKTIRCLRDDRVHDACSVTLDQCLSCTRYEPVLGQIYEILDDTGMNGSTVLDNMQMSYMNQEDYKALNRVEERNIKHQYANVNKDESETPKKIIKEWEEADKAKYMESLKATITDDKEYEEKINAIKQEDYAFIMNWYEQDLDLQEPDVKLYPTEGIKAKYKNMDIEANTKDGLQMTDNTILDETDSDYTDDLSKLDKLNQGEWVDTRENADTIEENKYSSEDFYFEDFNKDTGDTSGSIGGAFGAEARNKIVEMATQIAKEHENLKAAYDQNGGHRTIDHTKIVYKSVPRVNPNEKVAIYDCSSMVSTCYNYGGLKSVYGKTSGDQANVIKQGKTWPATLESAKDALPGDIIWHPGHIGIYLGDNKIAHASGTNYPKRGDIRIDDLDNALKHSFKNNPLFGRPKDLIEADEKAASMSTNINIDMKDKVVINGKEFQAVKIPQAVITAYYDDGKYSKTNSMSYIDVRDNKTHSVPMATSGKHQMRYCASHNLPYGTQIYVPELAQMGIGDGIFTVVDTGGHFFDFDIHVPSKAMSDRIGKTNKDVYVLRFGPGTGKDSGVAVSYCWICRDYKKRGQWPKLVSAWNKYQSLNGKLIHFHQFNKDDMNAQVSHPISPIGN